jgi:hypothetical protein
LLTRNLFVGIKIKSTSRRRLCFTRTEAPRRLFARQQSTLCGDGEVVLGKRSSWVVVLLPVLVLTVANAAPTVSNHNSNFVACAVSPTSDAHIPIVADVTHTIKSDDSYLAGATAEFLKPPPAFTSSPAPPVGAKSLPAVPGALLMVLTGFLCVSLVKDRKVWLSVLAGLLWLGQAGIQAVPQLALRLGHSTHTEQQLDAELTYPYYLENSNRLRSDIEGTQYIGLLHHLAGIPQDTMSFLSLSAIIPEQYSLNSLPNCLTLRVEQFICFSPAFIFENLPRGPPELA